MNDNNTPYMPSCEMAGRNDGCGANGGRGGNVVPPPPEVENERENVIADLLHESQKLLQSEVEKVVELKPAELEEETPLDVPSVVDEIPILDPIVVKVNDISEKIKGSRGDHRKGQRQAANEPIPFIQYIPSFAPRPSLTLKNNEK
ncbi:hypothetical protein RND71_013171 [Anisodus tanguticus]|uniref:Uncharacterized protein n=1 Tax=Anisodus tanguticus TaxID=243964 RepID=A0AAE1SH05_9SOLA|nr:hypothetical protein RND71_013171 [Anisodus tanguticus]